MWRRGERDNHTDREKNEQKKIAMNIIRKRHIKRINFGRHAHIVRDDVCRKILVWYSS